MTTVLGIETSCDETGIALYRTGDGLLAHTLYSQIELHKIYGGVVPEIASRDHLKRIIPLIMECLNSANISINDIDAIAYTAGPGLMGTLLVGAGVANGIAYSLNKPVIPIHHLEGHLLSPLLNSESPQFPFIALLVSGGHSQIIAVEKIGTYVLLGDSLDDAAGEAFDKTAKMLGLPYPGGTHIAKLATNGNDIYKLPRPMLHSPGLDMSFSGLKTAVLTLLKQLNLHNNSFIPEKIKCDIAKSIEEAITDVLAYKAQLALAQSKVTNLVVCGGVSANTTLRHKLNLLKQTHGIKIYYPPLKFCTDNGAMIAVAGHARYKMAQFNYNFKVNPRWTLNELDPIHD